MKTPSIHIDKESTEPSGISPNQPVRLGIIKILVRKALVPVGLCFLSCTQSFLISGISGFTGSKVGLNNKTAFLYVDDGFFEAKVACVPGNGGHLTFETASVRTTAGHLTFEIPTVQTNAGHLTFEMPNVQTNRRHLTFEMPGVLSRPEKTLQVNKLILK